VTQPLDLLFGCTGTPSHIWDKVRLQISNAHASSLWTKQNVASGTMLYLVNPSRILYNTVITARRSLYMGYSK
jgi:hypothetical protein